MELDILFWLAIGAIYLFQILANKRKQQGPVGDSAGLPQPDSREASGPNPDASNPWDMPGPNPDVDPYHGTDSRPDSRAPGGSQGASGSQRTPATQSAPSTQRTPATQSAPSTQRVPSTQSAPATLQDALDEISGVLTGQTARPPEPEPTRTSEPVSTIPEDTRAIPSAADDASPTAPKRESKYADLFENSLYDPFGHASDQKKLEIEILEPAKDAKHMVRRTKRLTIDQAREGIKMAEILGRPVSLRRHRRTF